MVGYFEIPVRDLDRAAAFYSAVFSVPLQRAEIDGYAMALFPDAREPGKIIGALAQGDSYEPATTGTLVYFSVPEIAEALDVIATVGGSIALPRTDVGDYGFVAEFIDCEGNRVGLSAPA